MSEKDFASKLSGKVGGTISGRWWSCADCPKVRRESTTSEAAKALYRHRQKVRHDWTPDFSGPTDRGGASGG